MRIDVKKNAFKGIRSGFLNRGFTIIMQFAYRTLILYFLGTEYLGLDGLFSSIFVFLSIAELGIGEVVVQSMYTSVANDDMDRIGALLNVYNKFLRRVSVIIFAVGMCLLPFIPFFIKGKEYPSTINLTVLYILYLINLCSEYAVLAYKILIFQAIQRTDVINNAMLVTNILKMILQIVAIVVFHNYYLVVVAMITATILKNLIIAYKASRDYADFKIIPKEIEESDRKKITENLKASFGQRLFGRVVASSDIITISIIMGLTSVAIYQNYVYILNSVMSFLTIVFSSLIAGIGNNLTTKDSQSNHRDFLHITFSYNMVVSWCSVTLLCLFQPFIQLWAGEEMVLPIKTMVILVIYFFLWHIKDTMSLYKDAAGIWIQDRLRPYVCSIINIVLDFILIHFWGLNGVIIATIISDFVISFPWIVIVMKKSFFKEGLSDYYLSMIDCTVMTIIGCLATYAVCTRITSVSVWGIALRLVICVTVPGIIYLIRYHKSEDFKWLMGMARHMIKK